MSRSHPATLPSYAGRNQTNDPAGIIAPIRDGDETPIQTISRLFSFNAPVPCLGNLPQPPIPIGGPGIPVSIPENLEGIKTSTKVILERIHIKLSECLLTEVQQGIKSKLFQGFDKMAALLLNVMRAHQEAANGIKHLIEFSPRGNVAQVVGQHLSSAWSSVDEAISEFNGINARIREQSQELKNEMQVSPGLLGRGAHKIVNAKIHQICTYPSFGFALAAAIYTSANSYNISQAYPGTLAVQYVFGYGAAFFGSLMSSIGYFGREGPIYEPAARMKTENALACIHEHLEQLSRAMMSLDAYWNAIHSTNIRGVQAQDPAELLRIVNLLEKHVDDCLVIISAIYCHIPGLSTVPPTQLDIDDARKGQAHGMHGLPTVRAISSISY